MLRSRPPLAAALVLLALGSPVWAQVKLSASLDSDYRYRGISRSGSRPALSLGMGYDHPSGFYVGASAIAADTGETAPRLVGAVEYAGYAWRDAAGRSWDLGVNNHEVEIYGATHRSLGYNEVYLGVQKDDISGHIYYSPNYFAPGARNAYFDLNAALPRGPDWRLLGHMGLQTPMGGGPSGGPPRRDRLDVRAGVARILPRGEVRLTWTGAWPRPQPETPQSRSGLVLGASVYF